MSVIILFNIFYDMYFLYDELLFMQLYIILKGIAFI